MKASTDLRKPFICEPFICIFIYKSSICYTWKKFLHKILSFNLLCVLRRLGKIQKISKEKLEWDLKFLHACPIKPIITWQRIYDFTPTWTSNSPKILRKKGLKVLNTSHTQRCGDKRDAAVWMKYKLTENDVRRLISSLPVCRMYFPLSSHINTFWCPILDGNWNIILQ